MKALLFTAPDNSFTVTVLVDQIPSAAQNATIMEIRDLPSAQEALFHAAFDYTIPYTMLQFLEFAVENNMTLSSCDQDASIAINATVSVTLASISHPGSVAVIHYSASGGNNLLGTLYIVDENVEDSDEVVATGVLNASGASFITTLTYTLGHEYTLYYSPGGQSGLDNAIVQSSLTPPTTTTSTMAP